MSQTFNMNEQQSGGSGDFDPIPRGRYPVRCVDANQTMSNNGNDMVDATFEITGDKYANRKIWDKFVWTEKAMWKVKQALDAGKSTLTDSDELSIERFVQELNGGMEFSALIEIDTYPGKDGESKKKNIMKNLQAIDEADAPKATSNLFK